MRPLNLRFYLWRLMPFFICIFLILLSSIPFHFFPYYPYRISWCFIPIFYFAIYNPKCLSSWTVFLLAIFSEFLTQSPLGVITFCFVLMFFIANFFRKYLLEFTFWPLWCIFASSVLMIEIIEYSLVSLLTHYAVSFQPVLVEFWILVLMYPFLIRFCAYLDRKAREVS